MDLEIYPTARETPEHVRSRHIVPALTDAGGNAAEGQDGRGQAQVGDFDAIASSLPLSEAIEINQPAEGCLQSEVGAGTSVAVEFAEEKPASRQGGEFRAERGEAAGNEVCVDEVDDAGVLGQELAGESRFARAVGPGNDYATGSLDRLVLHVMWNSRLRAGYQGACGQVEGGRVGRERLKEFTERFRSSGRFADRDNLLRGLGPRRGRSCSRAGNSASSLAMVAASRCWFASAPLACLAWRGQAPGISELVNTIVHAAGEIAAAQARGSRNVYKVQLKHRWSIGHNYLAGITAGDWFQLLKENGYGVDPVYWHRAAFITLASVMNSIYRRREERRYTDAIAGVKVAPPLFVLGHWRTGTTHLHNLLAQDTDQFAFANTYQVVNPHTFLCTEEVNARRFARLVPATRPMDNVALSFQTPQEDEFAPCLMSRRSLYLGISFARREDHYSRYLTFQDVPHDDVEAWKNAYRWFLQKLTFKYQRPLVLKSPPHTARIRLLLEMFPDARFVHIHRDPYTVFQSFRRYFDTAMWHTYLQKPDVPGIDDRIIHRYNVLFDAFFAQRALIPEGRFHEIRFEHLEKDPVGEMQKLYARLNLPGFTAFRPKLQRYVDSLTGYRKNEFPELEPAWRTKIARAWQRGFEEWSYPT